ncbi:MAG: multidrug ABC transporter ATP-binding protein [Alphaproteobacteria bacterium]|nr:MAG: multidrug ABC transporter ATP-binding protein [Alphaproteobacteria bacterium]
MFMKFKKIEHLPDGDLKFPNGLWAFIWFFVRQMKAQFSVIFVLYAISNVCVALIPYFIGETIAGFEHVAETGKSVMDVLFIPVCVFLTICFVFQPIIVQVGVYIQANTLSVFTNMVRRQLALYVGGHSYQYFQSDFSGRISGKIVEMPSAIRDVVQTSLGAFLYGVISFVVSIALFAFVSPLFAFISITWLVLYCVLMLYYIPKIKNFSEKGSVERSDLRGRCVDMIANISTVKLFSRTKHEDAYLGEKLNSTAECFRKTDMKLLHLWIWLEILSSVFWAVILTYCIFAWSDNALTTAQVAMILPLTFQLTNISWWLSEIFTGFFQRLGEIEEGMEAIVKPHTLVDDKGALNLKNKGGEITLRDVVFSYGDKNIFENFDLSIKAGEKIGLVGASGAGKSSLVQLLLRFYDIQEGEILIDGQNIAKVTQNSLRKNIAVIPQDTSLFHRSLMENIRYGRLDATEAEVIEAAKKAHAHEFIDELPQGYETLVGERGVKLSGGQRQRIAIARAILKNAPILILDEATSALDSTSEHLIQSSLKTLMKGKTVIAVAHRLSTIAHLDRLIVMDDGKIIEDGPHSELSVKEGGAYAKLWAMQSGGFLNNS